MGSIVLFYSAFHFLRLASRALGNGTRGEWPLLTVGGGEANSDSKKEVVQSSGSDFRPQHFVWIW
jgi:hypothetical protein